MEQDVEWFYLVVVVCIKDVDMWFLFGLFVVVEVGYIVCVNEFEGENLDVFVCDSE